MDIENEMGKTLVGALTSHKNETLRIRWAALLSERIEVKRCTMWSLSSWYSCGAPSWSRSWSQMETHLMGGMVCLCSSCVSALLSCMYSAMSLACACKYTVKALLAHLPLIFIMHQIEGPIVNIQGQRQCECCGLEGRVDLYSWELYWSCW